jgi:membrane associated rhomboid family serine protease
MVEKFARIFAARGAHFKRRLRMRLGLEPRATVKYVPRAMPYAPSFHDYRPITWWKRVPIYITTIICALLVVGMFATTVCQTANVGVTPLMFSVGAFWQRGWLWQLLTYPFIDQPSFFYLFSILFFYTSGIEVEKYLGRVRFMKLYALLVLLPVAIVSLWSLSAGMAFGGVAGPYDLTLGMFIAFATLYPNLEFWGFVPLKWFAFAGLALASMNHLPRHDWIGLSMLWGNCAAAFGFIRFLQRGGSMELPDRIFKNPFRRKPKFRVVPKYVAPAAARAGEEDVVESIDPLLDKIAKHGIKSLTARERERLERASKALAKKQPDR